MLEFGFSESATLLSARAKTNSEVRSAYSFPVERCPCTEPAWRGTRKIYKAPKKAWSARKGYTRGCLSRAPYVFHAPVTQATAKFYRGAILVSVLTGMWNFSAITETLPKAENRFAFSFVECNYLYFILPFLRFRLVNLNNGLNELIALSV